MERSNSEYVMILLYYTYYFYFIVLCCHLCYLYINREDFKEHCKSYY